MCGAGEGEGLSPAEGKALARQGLRAFLTMLLQHNLVHADLHPGNILARLDGEEAGGGEKAGGGPGAGPLDGGGRAPPGTVPDSDGHRSIGQTLEGSFERLYRNESLQVNMRLKALAEIYTMHSFALL